MRRVFLVCTLAAGLTAPIAAFAQDSAPVIAPPAPPAPSAPAKPAKDDPNRLVCTREREVGSNRPKKVCMTAAQRDEMRERARRNMDDSRRATDRGAVQTNSGA